MFKSPIAIGLSPNTQNDDVWCAVKMLFQPWKWKNGSSLAKVEEWFQKYLRVKDVSFFNSGRSALYAVLRSFEIGKGDEVLIQAFTCVAVPDPILWVGAKPIFVDVDESLNIDSKLLGKHITPKTKAIIVQHTFGIPAKMEMITKIAQKYNLILIEDCAHALGTEVNGRKMGTFGDAAIFSFGRDKVISSVFGGMAVINSKFKIQNSKFREFFKKLPYPSYFWILQQLLHPILFSFILPIYNIYLGKITLFFLQRLHLLSKPIYKEEVRGGMPVVFPKRYPNGLANLLLVQLGKLDSYNKKRQQIASYYFNRLSTNKEIQLPPKDEGSIYLRFNILSNKAEKILNIAKKNKILLGNWYRNIVDPIGVDLQKIGYQKESCPNAENVAKLSVNLPTYPRLTERDLELIVKLF